MGIIDFVKGGVRDLMVARPDAFKHLIVYKHPDGNIPNYARLNVDWDECAVFFRSGSPPTVAVLPPGRHPLSTENIPFLNRFVVQFTGGNVFQAEVFFVKTQPIRNLTFGGAMMSMRDPELELRVTPKAYGMYSLAIVDPMRFVIGYAGQSAQGDNEQITLWLRQRMFQALGKTLGAFLKSRQTTFMDLGEVAPDLAAALAKDSPDFSDIGAKILEVGELKISLSEEDQGRVDALQDQIAEAKLRARVARVGVSQAEAEAQQRQFALDQRFQQDARYVQQLAGGSFQQYAAGRAMIGAGEGMAQGEGAAGGVAASGAQLAVGLGMAAALQQGWAAGQMPAGAGGPTPAGAPRPDAASGGAVTCGKCSQVVPRGKFCQECGSPLASPTRRFCTACGGELATAKFCPACGTEAARA